MRRLDFCDNPAGKIEISAKNLELNVDGGMFGLVGKDVAFKKNANLELSGFDEVKIEADSVGMDFKSSLSVINSREEMPTDFALKGINLA